MAMIYDNSGLEPELDDFGEFGAEFAGLNEPGPSHVQNEGTVENFGNSNNGYFDMNSHPEGMKDDEMPAEIMSYDEAPEVAEEQCVESQPGTFDGAHYGREGACDQSKYANGVDQPQQAEMYMDYGQQQTYHHTNSHMDSHMRNHQMDQGQMNSQTVQPHYQQRMRMPQQRQQQHHQMQGQSRVLVQNRQAQSQQPAANQQTTGQPQKVFVNRVTGERFVQVQQSNGEMVLVPVVEQPPPPRLVRLANGQVIQTMPGQKVRVIRVPRENSQNQHAQQMYGSQDSQQMAFAPEVLHRRQAYGNAYGMDSQNSMVDMQGQRMMHQQELYGMRTLDGYQSRGGGQPAAQRQQAQHMNVVMPVQRRLVHMSARNKQQARMSNATPTPQQVGIQNQGPERQTPPPQLTVAVFPQPPVQQHNKKPPMNQVEDVPRQPAASSLREKEKDAATLQLLQLSARPPPSTPIPKKKKAVEDVKPVADTENAQAAAAQRIGSDSGWKKMNGWLKSADKDGKVSHLRDLLRQCLQAKISVDLLASNDTPKFVRRLSKKHGDNEVKRLSTACVSVWKKIISTPVDPVKKEKSKTKDKKKDESDSDDEKPLRPKSGDSKEKEGDAEREKKGEIFSDSEAKELPEMPMAPKREEKKIKVKPKVFNAKSRLTGWHFGVSLGPQSSMFIYCFVAHCFCLSTTLRNMSFHLRVLIDYFWVSAFGPLISCMCLFRRFRHKCSILNCEQCCNDDTLQVNDN